MKSKITEKEDQFSDVLLTVDYDRTLTAPDSTIPQRNLEAIRYFMAHGGVFTVNTGRSVPMCSVLKKLVPTNAPLLLYNGSAAYDVEEKKLSQVHLIPLNRKEMIQKIQAMLPNLIVECQGIDAHYNFEPNPAWDAFTEHNHCAHALASVDDDLGPFLKLAVMGKVHGTAVGTLFEATAAEEAEMDRAEALLRETFGGCCEIFRSGRRIIDIHAKGVSKLRCARELQERLGRKILVCVGDAKNDLTMLSGADYAFCPADGIVADCFENVCPCADGAVADVIYEKIPQILKEIGE